LPTPATDDDVGTATTTTASCGMDLRTPARQQQRHAEDASSSDFPGFNPLAQKIEGTSAAVGDVDMSHQGAALEAIMMTPPPFRAAAAAATAVAHVTVDTLQPSPGSSLDPIDNSSATVEPSMLTTTMSGLEARIMAKIASVCAPNAMRAAVKQQGMSAASIMPFCSGGGTTHSASSKHHHQDLRGTRDQQAGSGGTRHMTAGSHIVSSSLVVQPFSTASQSASMAKQVPAWGSSLQLGGNDASNTSTTASSLNTGGGSSARWGSVFKV
jgi:hypothetical protein